MVGCDWLNIVTAKDLSYSYRFSPAGAAGEHEPEPILVPAVKNLSISVKEGEFVAVLGRNGSGKSTFAKLINALLVPLEGSLEVGGLSTADEKNIWNIRQMAGMVFQNPDNQIIATIVEEDVAFGPENLGIPPAEIRQRVDWALEVVGMSEYAEHSPHFLSGGQKQRVSIAGVLAMKPRVIVLDEPTAMLDPIGRREVLAALAKLNRHEKMTVILITHYMEEAVNADTVYVMGEGRVVLSGTPREVFSSPAVLRELGLDVPQVTEIGYKLNEMGVPVRTDRLTIEEMTEEIAGVLGKTESDAKNLVVPDEGTISDERNIGTKVKEKIQIKDLNFTYNKGAVFEKKALININLTVENGEFIGLIGRTGSGKSTLIQQLNALLKPDNGSIIIDNMDIHADKERLKEVRQKVGLVFQYPEHQLFEATVAADIAFGPKNLGLAKEEIDRRVRWALDMVGLSPETAEKSPFDLSGGQKRRAAIAGVLAMKPQILILDEPAAGLDPSGRDEILEKIREMHARMGITVILVSHSMEDVARLVNRIIVINGGEIVMDGAPGSVFAKSRELEEMGLTSPQAARLAAGLREGGFAVPPRVYTPDGVAEAVAGLYTASKGLYR